MNTSQHHIIFIDGICVICNRLSQTLIRLDSKKQFLFSTLDSAFAQKKRLQPSGDSILVLSQDGTVYAKSKAIRFIIRQLPYVKWFGVLLYIIPRFILDHLYDRIAKNRYQWFGKHNSCPLRTHNRFIQ